MIKGLVGTAAIEAMMGGRDEDGATDGDLLTRVIEYQDGPAAAALVRRHAPMVWGVCRRHLASAHDAEDAFQAAFLVLFRRAQSVVPRQAVGNWLHGVARRTAAHVRAQVARRSMRERPVGLGADLPAPPPDRDLPGAIDAAVARLPDRYREVVVLCDLQGETRATAARRLGLPEGTVASRLARARAMLARRLGGPEAVGCVLAAAPDLSAAPAAAVRLATAVLAGRVGAVPAAASAVAQQVGATMLTKSVFGWGTRCCAALALGFAGLTVVGVQAGPLDRAATTAARVPAAPTAAAPVPKRPPRPAGMIVLDDCDPVYEGKPADKYLDNLTLIGQNGVKKYRVSGFNGCETSGSSRMVAGDAGRGLIWAVDMLADRVRQFDLDGRETLTINGVRPYGLSIDPATGNLWTTCKGEGKGEQTKVYDVRGKLVATHDCDGSDIVYDPKAEAFWVAGERLTKFDAATGKTLFALKLHDWFTPSLDVDPRTGDVWVALRADPRVAKSGHRLVKFGPNGKELAVAPLSWVDAGQSGPERVSVDRADGSVWVGCRQGLERFSSEGKSQARYDQGVLAVQVDPAGGVWVVTRTETQKLSPKGEVLVRVKHAGPTDMAWIAPLE
mgnify:CR=1 FL=1